MSKKKILVLVATLGFLALAVASTVTFANVRAASAAYSTTTVHLAFSGLVTTGKLKGTPLTGGLTEAVKSDGTFKGNLHLPGGALIPTDGKISSPFISITFYNAMSAVKITGTGKLEKAGDFIGRFQIFYKDHKIDNGIWSALPIASPKSVIALAFLGADDKGPDTGAVYTGAIVLNSKTLDGTFNLPNGVVVPVQGKLLSNNHIHVEFLLSASSKIVGEGDPVLSSTNTLVGFKGGFRGPQAGDLGRWVAVVFDVL